MCLGGSESGGGGGPGTAGYVGDWGNYGAGKAAMGSYGGNAIGSTIDSGLYSPKLSPIQSVQPYNREAIYRPSYQMNMGDWSFGYNPVDPSMYAGRYGPPSLWDQAGNFLKQNILPFVAGTGASLAFGPAVGALVSTGVRAGQNLYSGMEPKEAIGKALVGGMLGSVTSGIGPAGEIPSGLAQYALSHSKGLDLTEQTSPGTVSSGMGDMMNDVGYFDISPGGNTPNIGGMLVPYSVPQNIAPQQQIIQPATTAQQTQAMVPTSITPTTTTYRSVQPYSTKNIPDIMASRGVKGAGTLAPINQWY